MEGKTRKDYDVNVRNIVKHSIDEDCYISHPLSFFVSSQLVSSLSEPPPPVPIVPLPPTARKSLSISSLGTFISSLSCFVRVLVRSLINSVVPVHETLPNSLWVAFSLLSTSVLAKSLRISSGCFFNSLLERVLDLSSLCTYLTVARPLAFVLATGMVCGYGVWFNPDARQIR